MIPSSYQLSNSLKISQRIVQEKTNMGILKKWNAHLQILSNKGAFNHVSGNNYFNGNHRGF